MAVAVKKKSAKAILRFDQRLVLNRWALSLFGVEEFEDLATLMKDPDAELIDDENVSQFARVLIAHFPRLHENGSPGPSPDDLLRYDTNIVRWTDRIARSRGETLRWKYFQYLALLFTEIYLDRYFTDESALRELLAAFVDDFNQSVPSAADEVDPYEMDDIHKLAFWMATGSGKTLLMHVNILQYLHYLELHGRRAELNRIILLTPNEGLSKQHKDELDASGIHADLFNKDAPGPGLFASNVVEIIDIHKLAEEMGDKTVAVDAFEDNNLVLVDEGHRGSGGEDWKGKRDRLCRNGFSFEYSATFGQAVKAANKGDLTQEYAKCILFDYSYRFFYNDGYGKDYQILNLDSIDPDVEHHYLTAALLAFYQQLLIYQRNRDAFSPYGIDRPLWIFVGGSVTASLSKDDKSDIHAILAFIARFAGRREESVAVLRRLISGVTGITYKGKDVFANKFPHVDNVAPEDLYTRICSTVFNAAGGSQLCVQELRNASGELSLSLGDHTPFGVINVGDAPALRKLLDGDPNLNVSVNEFGASLFETLNKPASRTNILLGSKKFTEGWNSWRVSSMGLMNVGKNEGAQIIQLFGRGVRLRGLGNSLKRSTEIAGDHPDNLRILETLNVYGVHAGYMQKFKEYLEDEGMDTESKVEIVVPVRQRPWSHPLKSIRIRDGGVFKRDAGAFTLGPPTDDIDRRPITLDWYPKIQSIDSAFSLGTAATLEIGRLEPTHLAFIDLDDVWFQLVAYKNERGRTNLTIPREAVESLLRKPNWYELRIPNAELAFPASRLDRRIRSWQEIAVALLKKYVDRWYRSQREAWETPRREYYPLEADDRTFIREYRFEVPEKHTKLIERLKEVAWQLEFDEFEPWTFDSVELFDFERHLFRPLVHTYEGSNAKVTPTPLNKGERDFVRELRTYIGMQPAILADKHLYLLRNPARLGVGFFEAGNFYPDFLLWLVHGDRQYLSFVDPKGIARMALDDPKLQFGRTIKDVQGAMAQENVVLNAFIVANTSYATVAARGPKTAYEAAGVLFQIDDRTTYIARMIQTILAETASP